jgi:hypothetical protein
LQGENLIFALQLFKRFLGERKFLQMTNYIEISEKLEKIAGPFFLGMNSTSWLAFAGIVFLFGVAGLLFFESRRKKIFLFYISFLGAVVGIWLGNFEGDYSDEKISQVMKDNKIEKINARKLVQNVKILSKEFQQKDVCNSKTDDKLECEKEKYINRMLDSFYNSENTDNVKFKGLEK